VLVQSVLGDAVNIAAGCRKMAICFHCPAWWKWPARLS